VDVHCTEPCNHRECKQCQRYDHKWGSAKSCQLWGESRYVQKDVIPYWRDKDAEEADAAYNCADREYRPSYDAVVVLGAEKGNRGFLCRVAEGPEHRYYRDYHAPECKGFCRLQPPGDSCGYDGPVCLGDKGCHSQRQVE